MAAILAALLLVMSSEQVLAQDYQGQVVTVLQTTLLTVTYAGSGPPSQDYSSPPPDVSPLPPAPPTTSPPEVVSMTSYCYIPDERPCLGNDCLSGLFANPGPASAFCATYTTTTNTDDYCPDFATGCSTIIFGLSSAW